MPAPTIRYAQAKDGGRVAFHTLGTGPALVMLFPLHVSHLTLNWEVPLHRTGIQFFARHFQVINLDCRGGGLSERRIACLSLDSLVADIAWSYPTPLPESQKIAGLVAFYNEHVDLTVDGVALERPTTPFS